MNQRAPRAIHDLATVKITDDDFLDREGIAALDALVIQNMESERTTWNWTKLLVGALSILLTLAVGLWIDNLIRSLFDRYTALGWFALGVAIFAFVALICFIIRELHALFRLASVEHIRESARNAVKRDDMAEARRAVKKLITFTEHQPLATRGRKALLTLGDDIIDGRALIHLAEGEVLRPLDIEARALIMASAKRVSIVTAVSPRALIDLGYVFFESARLIRSLATLYGCRPGRFGFFTILRKVLSHLAVTGSIAAGDGLMQQIIGQGLAARLSARLGEGVINGLMTTRIGIAAMDALRPFPFDGERRPGVADFAGDIISFSNKQKNEDN